MVWAVLLPLLYLLLSLRLFSLISRLLIANPSNSVTNNSSSMQRIFHLAMIPLLLSATIFALSDPRCHSSSGNGDGLIAEVENLKLKVAKLESILEENTNTLNSKILHLDENNKLIVGMEQKIEILQQSVSNLKISIGSSSDSKTMVKALEEEVKLLLSESRKNNLDYHTLESKVHEEENKLEKLTSEVIKMEDIITEQWIQIRQFEQSLQLMKIMASKVRKKTASKVEGENPLKFNLLKFIKHVRRHHLPVASDLPDAFFLGNYITKPNMSRASKELRRIWSAGKRWHHELQDLIKRALEMSDFTAPLANIEVVFFLASAVIVMPIMSIWTLLC